MDLFRGTAIRVLLVVLALTGVHAKRRVRVRRPIRVDYGRVRTMIRATVSQEFESLQDEFDEKLNATKTQLDDARHENQALQREIAELKNIKISELSAKIRAVDWATRWMLDVLKKQNKIDGHRIRLSGGNSSYEGRVEVYIMSTWGTICDFGWGNSTANVVCRQLGKSRAISYDDGEAANDPGPYGAGSGPIWTSNVRCTGTESRIMDCSFTFTHNCNHHYDAWVKCSSD